MLSSEVIVEVRYSETDCMGIAHHSSYVLWLEVARMGFFDALGFEMNQLEEKGIMLPVMGIQVNYQKSVRFKDRLLIATSIKSFTRTRVKFGYKLITEDTHQIVATAETSHTWTNKQLKPINLSKTDPALFLALGQ